MLEKLSFDKMLLAIFSQFRSSIFKIFLAPWPQPGWGLRVKLNDIFSLCPPSFEIPTTAVKTLKDFFAEVSVPSQTSAKDYKEFFEKKND